MKFKIGDTVKIKSNAKEIQAGNWTSAMDECQGQEGTVNWVSDDGCSVTTDNGFDFFYENEALEPIERADTDISDISTDDLLKELFRRIKA